MLYLSTIVMLFAVSFGAVFRGSIDMISNKALVTEKSTQNTSTPEPPIDEQPIDDDGLSIQDETQNTWTPERPIDEQPINDGGAPVQDETHNTSTPELLIDEHPINDGGPQIQDEIQNTSTLELPIGEPSMPPSKAMNASIITNHDNSTMETPMRMLSRKEKEMEDLVDEEKEGGSVIRIHRERDHFKEMGNLAPDGGIDPSTETSLPCSPDGRSGLRCPEKKKQTETNKQ